MEEFIRVWRHLPKFLFGFLFVASIAVTVLGQAKLTYLATLVTSFTDWKEMGEIVSGVVVLMLLLTVSSFGLLLLDFLLDLMSIIFARLFAVELIRRIIQWLNLAELTYPLSDIVSIHLATDEQLLLEYTMLKGQAMPEYLDKAKLLEKYIASVRAHLGHVRHTPWVEVLTYYASVTQDQKKLERFEEEIRELYYLMISSTSIVISLIITGVITNTFISLIIILIFFTALAPVISQRKSWLAAYIAASFVDVFTAGAGSITTVEDRDGI